MLNASCLSLTLEGQTLGRWGSRKKEDTFFFFFPEVLLKDLPPEKEERNRRVQY